MRTLVQVATERYWIFPRVNRSRKWGHRRHPEFFQEGSQFWAFTRRLRVATVHGWYSEHAGELFASPSKEALSVLPIDQQFQE